MYLLIKFHPRLSTHLQQVNGVHDRVFGDTSEGAGCHVGRQAEVWRQALVAVVVSLSIGPFLSRSISQERLTHIRCPRRGSISLARTYVRP